MVAQRAGPRPRRSRPLAPLLTGIEDLWVDKFVAPDDVDKATLAVAGALPLAALPLDVRTGLANSKRTVTVKQKNGDPVTVRFGGIARMGERDEPITVPGGPPGSPPQTIVSKAPVPYRYARIDGNAQLFTVRADKYADLFPTVEQLKDTQVARYTAEDVWELVIHRAGVPDIKLMRKKGNPQAANPIEKTDRWLIDVKPNPLLADTDRIRELLNLLAGFRADSPERISYPAKSPDVETVITITSREKRAEGEPDAPARTITLQLGKPDYVKNLLPVQLQGWPRVTLVSDKYGPDDLDSWVTATFFPKTISGLLARPPLAYRGRKLFDTAEVALSSVSVASATNGFALAKEAGEWKLSAPVQSAADPGKADELAASLSFLQAIEYLSDSPTAADLQSYGLDTPAQTVTLNFTGTASDSPTKRTYKLELGKPRTGKSEVYARLDNGGVFVLPSSTVEHLTTGVLGLMPLRVWSTVPDKITGLEITRTGDQAKQSFALVQDGTNWKLSGPFTASVPFPNAQPLLTSLSNLMAVKYQAMTVGNPAEYGFDKPNSFRIKLSFLEKKPVQPGSPPSTEEQPATRTLIVGGIALESANTRYAMLDMPNAPVFVVTSGFVFAAQTPPLDLLDRSLLFVDVNRIAKVRVAPEKAEDAFTLVKDDKGKWSVEGISFAVDLPRISGLINTAGKLPVFALADYGDAVDWAKYGLDKPEKPVATITITLAGDKPVTHTIALGKADQLGSRYVRVDDGKAVGQIQAVAANTLTHPKFDYADHSLLTFDPTALNGFNRKRGAEELELASAAVGWDEVKPEKRKADQPFLDELADTLGKLRAERIAAYGKKDELFKKYGLVEPAAAVITLTIGDKAEQKVLRLGNPVDPAKPDGEHYAAVESASPETIVGVIPATLASKLLAKEVAFRDRTLAKFVDADKAILERGDRKIAFAKVGATWKVTEPLATAAESAELEGLVADLGKLRADTWVGPKTGDLSAYGLAKPQAKWQLFDGDKPVLTLLLGSKLPDGRVHVATDKSELVGLLDLATTNRVLAEYRQRRPWEVDAAQVEAVEIARGSTSFDLQKAGPLWVDPAKPADPIEIRAVNELLFTLGGLARRPVRRGQERRPQTIRTGHAGSAPDGDGPGGRAESVGNRRSRRRHRRQAALRPRRRPRAHQRLHPDRGGHYPPAPRTFGVRADEEVIQLPLFSTRPHSTHSWVGGDGRDASVKSMYSFSYRASRSSPPT